MRAILCGLAGCLAAAAAGRADEESLPLDKVPKLVLAAVKKRFPGAEMTEASKETTDDKKTVYEVSVKDGNRKVDVTLTAEGAITTLEKEIDSKDLPKPVREVIRTKYPNATYRIAEEVVKVKDGKETLDYYEALLELADKKRVEVEVTAGGEIKKTEDKPAAGDKDK